MTALAFLMIALVQDDAGRLVERLRSEKVDEREEAELRLKLLGDAALPALEKAAADPDPEVVDRAKAAIEAIPRLRGITPALEKAFPGVRARLAARRLEAWTRVFLEAVEQKGATRRHPELGRGDLEPLAPSALRGAAPAERVAVFGAVAAWRLEAAGPELLHHLDIKDWDTLQPLFDALEILRPPGAADRVLERVKGEPDQNLRKVWMHLLARLGDRRVVPMRVEALSSGSDARAIYDLLDLDAVEAVPTLLRSGRNALDSDALFVLSMLAPGEVIPAFVRDLADEREDVRDRAAHVIASHRSRDAIPELLKLLDHPTAEYRWLAPGPLAELRAREAVEPLRKRLADDSTRVRRAAARALAAFGVREALPELVMELRDPKSAGAAAWALADLGARETIPDLLPLLQEAECRKVVAEALGRLGAVEALPAIRKMLEDPDAETRSYGAWALAFLQGKEAVPALEKLLSDPDANVRNNALNRLRYVGARPAASISESWAAILRDLESPDVHVRSQAAWKIGSPDLDPPEATLRVFQTHPDSSIRQRAAKALAWAGSREGIPILLRAWTAGDSRLELNAARRPELWRAWKGRTLSGVASGNAREALESVARQAGLTVEWPSTDEPWMYASREVLLEGKSMALAMVELLSASSGALFEPDRVRVFSWGEARAFWRRWWAETDGGPEAKRWLAEVEEAEERRKVRPPPEPAKVLTPGLKAVPGLEERLQKGSDEIWAIVLLEAGFWSPKTEYKRLVAEDLDALAVRALRGTTRPEQLEQVLGMIGAKKLRSAHREVGALLSHAAPKIRAAAAGALLGLDGRAALPRVLPLLDDPAPEARSGIVGFLGGHRLTEALPKILEKKDDPAIRNALATAGSGFRSPDLIPILLELARHDGQFDAYMRRVMAHSSLGLVAGPEHAPHYREFLKTEDHPNALWSILSRLGTWGDREAIPQIVALLEANRRFGDIFYPQALRALADLGAPQLKDQVLKKLDSIPVAADLAGEMGFREAIPALRKELGGNPYGIAPAAARALGKLGDRDSLPALRALLGHEQQSMRDAAAVALARLGDRESLPRILELCRQEGQAPAASLALMLLAGAETPAELRRWIHGGSDPEAWPLMAALGGEAAVAPFQTALRSEWQDVRWRALQVVGRIPGEESLAELKRLLADPDESVRGQAACFVCRRGLRDGVPALVDAETAPWHPIPSALNALRRPAAWKRLEEKAFKEPLYAPAKEIFARIAAEAGFKLEGPPAGSPASLPWAGRHYRLGPASLAEAVETMEHENWAAILEDDRIRILPRKDAVEFWKAWWGKEPR